MDKEVKEFIEQSEYWQHIPHDKIDAEAEERIKDLMAFQWWRLKKELKLLVDEIKQSLHKHRYSLVIVWGTVLLLAILLT